jgi:hypothetical protein
MRKILLAAIFFAISSVPAYAKCGTALSGRYLLTGSVGPFHCRAKITGDVVSGRCDVPDDTREFQLSGTLEQWPDCSVTGSFAFSNRQITIVSADRTKRGAQASGIIIGGRGDHHTRRGVFSLVKAGR